MGSGSAGSERVPSWGAQPAPIEDATSVGTIVMREGLDTKRSQLVMKVTIQGGMLYAVSVAPPPPKGGQIGS
jgi:hypothetical protein